MTAYLIEGFRRGVSPTDAELATMEAASFDTTNEVSGMTTEAPTPDFEQLAARWRCSSRTVRRMHAAGVDVLDPVAVGAHLASLRAPSDGMLAAVLAELSDT